MRKILIISALTIASSISTAALCGETLSSSTRQDLLAAMKNEAFSYLKYKLFAEQARKNGNETLAGVLEHTTADEYEKHFKEHAKLYGLVKSDHENLVNAMSAEFVESTQMYQDMAKKAEAAGDATVAKHFSELARDEIDRRDAFKGVLSKRAAQ